MTKKVKDKKKSKDSSNTTSYTGKLEITRGGLGFVIVEGLQKDIMVKPDQLNNALNGDTVTVEVRGYSDNNNRREGRVTSVVKRKQSEFSGTVQVHKHFAFLVPDNDKINVDIYIPLHLLNNAVNGDKAIARIIEWTAKAKNPVGEIVTILTDETTNEIAMQGILTENGFPLSFPDEVLEEAARYSEYIDKDEVKKRHDLRDVLTMTIDPVDAKDFDDALSFRALKGGWYEVGVHIADVGHFIQEDSALDKEAYARATSVYLPDRVLPMLPERLSNELCSLRPNEDKYTFSAVFKVNKKGQVKDPWIGKTLIHSDRRFAYEEVQEMIEGADGDHKEAIMILNEMAQNLRKERFAKGAINFSSQEVRFKLDENAKPIGIVIKESKEAHQLIEEFMLLANRTVAEYVSGLTYKDKPIPFPYRVHDEPDPDKLKMFTAYAGRFGVRFDLSNPETVARSFNQMLKVVQGKPEQHVLEQLGIRTMAKAVYTTENVGHYGLGFDDYCHFTSPIRRYPDVLVHRVVYQCLEEQIKPIKDMEAKCRHCSDQERRAMEAERAANKYKQVEYMQDYVGEEFEAVISGISAFGFWAETVAHKCEGMVSIHDLAQVDDFTFLEAEYALVGRHTGMRFAMGDKVVVRVVAANLEKRQIDYTLAQLIDMPKLPLARKDRSRPSNQKGGKQKDYGKRKDDKGGKKKRK